MTEMKMDSANYLKRRYARLVLPAEDGTFSAEIFEFPGCIAVGGTPSEALANLEETALDWIEAALAQNQNIPEPINAADYSGKLVLRMSKSLHKRASMCAEREGVSLNNFITTCVAEAVGEKARPQQILPSQFQVAAQFTLQITGTTMAIGQAPIALGPASSKGIITGGSGVLPVQWRELEREHA